ncbi:MAG: 6-phospho-beta-glucosidase [Chloroflexota bacterium]|nr:6-phospho-beta-glucosidase [Chloroflexota bacterium]
MSKPTIEKIAVIGGGSTYTPELIDGFIQHEPDLQVNEIALYDIDEERLNVVGGMAQRQVKYAEMDTKVTLNLDRPRAVDGAKFVLSSMRIGHMAARILDEKIPLKYNVIGQETTGPGGTFKAFRTIPVTLDIAKDMEKYAPDAWYINFTNPSGIMTEAILKHTNLNVVGLCNNPINTIAAMAEAFHVEPKDVFLEWMGLNHVNWVRKVYIKGEDVTQQLIDNLEKMVDIEEMPKIDPDLVRTLGVMPTYYLQYYYFHPQRLAEAKAAEKSRGEVVLEVEKELLKKYADPKVLVKPPELAQRGGARYSEAAVNLIMSLMLDRRDVQIVVARNGTSIPDLEPDASVEVPCVVGAHGVTPLSMGRLPESIRALCQQAKSWESATVKAAVSGSKRDAYLAMLQNPLVPDYTTAVKLVDEMLEAHKQYLPQFFKN